MKTLNILLQLEPAPGAKIFLIVIGIVIFVAILYALRELFCWYWKINDMIQNQKEQTRLLKKIAGEKDIVKQKEESVSDLSFIKTEN